MCNFLYALVGVILISINVESKCSLVSLFTLTDPDCDEEHTPESRKIMEYQPFYKMDEISRYYQCSLVNLGVLEDGNFKADGMETLIEKHVDSKVTKDALLARFIGIAYNVTKLVSEEDSYDRARVFAQLNYEAEIEKHLMMGYYCSYEILSK